MRSLRVLLLEDSDDDVHLLLRELRKGEYAPDYQQVTTEEALLTALQTRQWDVVIADYFLPDINALQALELVQAIGLDLPFIVVSAVVGEEAAVSVMKAGAHDFLTKRQLKRLVPAIEREIQEAQVRLEKQKAEEALRHAFDELEQLVEQRTVALVQTNQQLTAEVQERERSQHRLNLQYQVAHILATSSTIHQAVSSVLQAIGQAQSWQLAELWLVDASGQRLEMHGRWHSDSVTEIELASAMEAMRSQNSSSDAVALLASELPMPDSQALESAAIVQNLPDRIRRFPVLGQQKLLGALCLYRRDEELDPKTDQLIATISHHLGQFIQRNQAEDAMFQLAAIVQSSEDAIISINLVGQVLSWNAGAEKLYGYSAIEAVGQRLAHLIQSEIALEASIEDDRRCIGPNHQQGVHRRKDGRWMDVFMTLSPIRDATNTVIGISMIATDISDRRAVERMKDEFISIISHELRTPLASLQGSVELLLTGALGELSNRGQRLLKIIDRNLDRLTQLTDTILDLQQFASSEAALSLEVCNLGELMSQAVTQLQMTTGTHQIQVAIDPKPIQVLADPKRILQVITELLGNAIKFSPAGSTVWLAAELQPPPEDLALAAAPTVLVWVKDHGQGIPADKLETIFHCFRQADSSDSRPQCGAGLGLAICFSIVRLHRGHLWAESQEGQGSTFYLLLPALRK